MMPREGGYAMDRISLDLTHCYGIKRLQHDLDFSKTRVFALYAPNGVMKSSLAQTFLDAAKGQDSRDRIFGNYPVDVPESDRVPRWPTGRQYLPLRLM